VSKAINLNAKDYTMLMFVAALNLDTRLSKEAKENANQLMAFTEKGEDCWLLRVPGKFSGRLNGQNVKLLPAGRERFNQLNNHDLSELVETGWCQPVIAGHQTPGRYAWNFAQAAAVIRATVLLSVDTRPDRETREAIQAAFG